MSATGDNVFVLLFFAGMLAVTLGEIYFLSKHRSVTIRRAMVYVFSAGFVTITLGFFVSFAIFALLLMATTNDAPFSAAVGWSSLFAALLFPLALMAVLKRILFPLLHIEGETAVWKYSLLATFAFFAAVLGPPAVYFFIT